MQNISSVISGALTLADNQEVNNLSPSGGNVTLVGGGAARLSSGALTLAGNQAVNNLTPSSLSDLML